MKTPDKMVDKILNGEITNKTNYCIIPNGAFFRKDKRGFLPELMETIYNDRVKYKKLLLSLNKNMKIPKIRNISSTFHDMKISRLT